MSTASACHLIGTILLRCLPVDSSGHFTPLLSQSTPLPPWMRHIVACHVCKKADKGLAENQDDLEYLANGFRHMRILSIHLHVL